MEIGTSYGVVRFSRKRKGSTPAKSKVCSHCCAAPAFRRAATSAPSVQRNSASSGTAPLGIPISTSRMLMKPVFRSLPAYSRTGGVPLWRLNFQSSSFWSEA